MKSFGLVSAAVLTITLAGQAAFAQSTAVPAEFPPASFTGNQFVDSQGCAFVRAGIGGNVNWVPRVSRTRDQLCNFQPTLGAGTAVAAAPAAGARNAPNPLAGLPTAAEIVAASNGTPAPTPAPVAAAPTPAPAPAPAPVRAPAPRVNTNVGAPIQTVASLTTTPRLIQPAATPRPATTPRVVTAPTPAPTPAPAPVERRTTLAEACEGRFGIQRGFISAQTRQPINCGPEPVVQAAVVSAPQIIAPTPAPAPVASGPRELTLAQACLEISQTGRQFVNAATGLPVRCAPQTQPAPAGPVFAGTINAGPAAPSAPAAPRAPSIEPVRTAAVTCSNISSVGAQYLVGGNGLAVRCGPQTVSPTGNGLPVQVTRRATAPIGDAFFGIPAVPASNPRVVSRSEVIRPPSGYERVWGDGRLNTQRGLPAGAIQRTTIRQTARIATPTVTPTATGHRFVQVGTFGDAGNAQRAAQQFQGMGLPVAAGRSGGGMQVIAIGPFGSAGDLQRALRAARSAGYSDAFTRN